MFAVSVAAGGVVVAAASDLVVELRALDLYLFVDWWPDPDCYPGLGWRW